MNESAIDVLRNTSRVWDDKDSINVTGGLIDLCRDWVKPDFTIAEIGCFAGVSTAIFANFAKLIYAIDPWELGPPAGYGEIPATMIYKAAERFKTVMAEYNNIHQIIAFSPAAADRFAPKSLDMIYLDGAHDDASIRRDIRAWLPKIKPGGVLAGHDCGLVGDPTRFGGTTGPVKGYSESSWAVRIA